METWYTVIDCANALFSYFQEKKRKFTFAFTWVEIQYIFTTLSKVLKFYPVL